jgi:phenylalanyl-tRNA synthetase beta chain
MGHGTRIRGNTIEVTIPCYRADVMHPIDLVEDVAIAHDYDAFEPVIPPIHTAAGEDPKEVFSRQLRNFMVGFGLMEVVTFMMSNRDKLFTRMMLPEEPICETENPKMETYDSLRNRLLPSLMEILSFNKHHGYPQNLYEVDDVVVIDPSTETGARTRRRLAVVMCYARANFSEIKGLMNSVLENLELKADVSEGGWPCFIEGRRFTATVDGEPLCWAGEIRPEVLEGWGLEIPVAALEMDLDLLFRLVQG